jgi:DNA (cytosine-5)-methyltransferase 1
VTNGTPAARPYDPKLATLDQYDAPIVDLFAGPGGWDEGAAMIGVTNTYGLEFEANACRTAEAAGHARFLGDLSTVDPADYRPAVGLIASPPCQAWSMAGKQLARLDRPVCHDLVRAYATGRALEHTDIDHEWNDPRSHLVAEPMRWIVGLEPEWVVLEEVPTVLDLWATYHRVLESMGYSVWHGVLNSADYGVPQTRKRAILIASRTRTVGRPEATHSQEGSLLTEPWRTMEHVAPEGVDAFAATNIRPNTAVRMVTEPAPTLAFGHERPRWITMAEALGWSGAVRFPRRSDGRDEVIIDGEAERARDLRDSDQPAQVVTEKARSWIRMGTHERATVRHADEPAPTVMYGSRANAVTWHEDDPRKWTSERPATTVVGSFRPDIIAAPGWRKPGDGPRQNAAGSVRVEAWEAGVLQSFRSDYPWQGAKTRQYQQIGNAVPPRLAAHVLAEAIGLERSAVLERIAAYYEESRQQIAARRSA